MKTEEAVRSELAKARAEYHEASTAETAAQLAARSKRIKELDKELSDVISAGANACSCGNGIVIGMLKRPETRESGPQYEVGCIACGKRARAWSPTAAVARWNAGEFLPPK